MAYIPINIEGIEEFKNFLPKFIGMLSENSNGNDSDIFKLFENYIKAKEANQKMIDEGIIVPKALIISPTMRCNLNCIGCYAKGYSKDGELSLEEFDKVINEAKDLGIFLFIISGGEPFLKEGLLDLLTCHRDVLFWIFTNGTLFTETLAGQLKKYKTIFPFFSIEGFRRETDMWRGKGVYDKVITAMELAKERNVSFGFSTTVTKGNISVITQEEFMDGMIEKGCKVGIYIDYNHVAKNIPDTFSCNRAEKSALKEVIEKYSENMEIALIYQSAWEEMAGGCCGAGSGILHINSQGFVEPCPMFRFAGDNIRDKSLEDILKSEIFIKIRQERKKSAGQGCPIYSM